MQAATLKISQYSLSEPLKLSDEARDLEIPANSLIAVYRPSLRNTEVPPK